MIKNNLYNNSLKYVKIISILIVISLLFDVLVYVEGAESNLSYFKGVIVYGYLIIVLLRYNILKLDTSNNIVLLLILYWMCLIFFSSDIMLSFKMYTKIVAPLIVYVFTSNLYPNNKHFKYIYISFSCVIIISVLYGIISNFLGLKDSYAMKREAIETYSIGLGDGKLYAQSIAIIIFPFVYFNFKLSNKQKIIMGILLLMVIIYSILSLRRTTISIIILGALLFYYFSGRITKLYKIAPPIIIFLMLTFSLWYPILESRMSLRTSTFSNDYNIEEEGRYREIPFVLDETIFSSNATRFLFGKELFNSNGNYAGGIFGTRMIHIDYMGILHGSGVLGICLYFMMYISIFRKFKRRYINNSTLTRTELISYKGLFYSTLILSLFISLSGQMYEMTFRTMLFFLLGILTSNVQNEFNNKHQINK